MGSRHVRYRISRDFETVSLLALPTSRLRRSNNAQKRSIHFRGKNTCGWGRFWSGEDMTRYRLAGFPVGWFEGFEILRA
jgi:hypothetical protein